jgi:hypothetical protein
VEVRGKAFSTIGATLLFLAGIWLIFPNRPGGSTIVVAGRSGAGIFGRDSTLRNVTSLVVKYAVRDPESGLAGVFRKIKAGEVVRIRTGVPVTIVYENGVRAEPRTIQPGMPYSFRFDGANLVRLYPGSHGRSDAADLAPYVPTPPAVLRRMLEMAGVGRDDVVYDLGCGDGRIVLAAAREFGARGVGIDIDPNLIAAGREEARKEGVESRVRFICMDASKALLRDADVLALYLLPESLEDLRPRFERDLKTGARVVTHDYRVPGWDERMIQSDAVRDTDGLRHTIFLYRK